MTEVELTVPNNFSPERIRLLETLAKGEHESITALCESANVSRYTYYAALQSPEFVQELFKTTTGEIYAAIPKIMSKIVEQAKRGSFAHQKMLLEMVKLYQGVPDVQINQQTNNYSFGWIGGDETTTHNNPV